MLLVAFLCADIAIYLVDSMSPILDPIELSLDCEIEELENKVTFLADIDLLADHQSNSRFDASLNAHFMDNAYANPHKDIFSPPPDLL